MPSHHDRAKSTLFIQASGSLRDLYDRRWISYGVFTGMCLYSPVVVITMEVSWIVTDVAMVSIRAIPIGL